MRKKLLVALSLVIIAAAALVTTITIPASAQAAAAPYCGITWGSGAKVATQQNTSTITNVRTGQHECFDRMVIDLNGSAPGYNVSYVSEFNAEGSGFSIPLQGGAKLHIIALASAYDSNYNPTYRATNGTLTNLTGYQTFRDLKFGGSFEGQTTFGLGVRARLPFRVFQLDQRLVIDVAHRWQ